MININRPAEAPASLQDPRIQTYLNQLSAHKTDPENNPQPSKPISYRSSDLIDAFESVFHSKCYLTEQWEFTGARFEVDHFLPQNERPDLVYQWTNIFPIDHFANKMRPKYTPDGGYMDPCNRGHDVENEIIYGMDFESLAVYFSANDEMNTRAVNSASLLDRLHNGHNENTIRLTSALRKAIEDVYNSLCLEVDKWRSEATTQQDRETAEKKNSRYLKSKIFLHHAIAQFRCCQNDGAS